MSTESWELHLAIARYSLNTTKPQGSFYGYPAALLLLTIVDVIGSFHFGDKSFKVQIDGKPHTINGGAAKHFYILNSAFYDQKLTMQQINDVYDWVRCPLAHNASLVPGVVMHRGSSEAQPFGIDNKGRIDNIDLSALLAVSEIAVSRFLAVAPTMVFENRRHAQLYLKR